MLNTRYRKRNNRNNRTFKRFRKQKGGKRNIHGKEDNLWDWVEKSYDEYKKNLMMSEPGKEPLYKVPWMASEFKQKEGREPNTNEGELGDWIKSQHKAYVENIPERIGPQSREEYDAFRKSQSKQTDDNIESVTGLSAEQKNAAKTFIAEHLKKKDEENTKETIQKFMTTQQVIDDAAVELSLAFHDAYEKDPDVWNQNKNEQDESDATDYVDANEDPPPNQPITPPNKPITPPTQKADTSVGNQNKSKGVLNFFKNNNPFNKKQTTADGEIIYNVSFKIDTNGAPMILPDYYSNGRSWREVPPRRKGGKGKRKTKRKL